MIPELFLNRMKNMLGDEYPEFERAITSLDAVRGARVNLIKAAEDYLPDIENMTAERIDYARRGYILTGDGRVGQSPDHHAGLIYMQDPGAMAALEAIDIDGDLWVADLCSAPGGKSSQIAERLGDNGFLLSNEYVPKRAKILVGNLERLGHRQGMVTSADTGVLAEWYPECFDLVVCDAPCSGEGMFRKSEEARAEWSEENVKMCQRRQEEILENAYRLLAPGGRLLYSTCTWSKEEDEDTVLNLLTSHEDLTLIPLKEEVARVSSPGIKIENDGGHDLTLTRRIYPHKVRGEGQYIALIKKAGERTKKKTFVYKEAEKSPTREEMGIIDSFFSDTLTARPKGRIVMRGDMAILISHGCPIPPHSVFMPGVPIGEVRRGVLHVHHHFFSAYGMDFKSRIELTKEDAERYIRGEEIAAPCEIKGYCVLTYRGAVIGGGKASSGRVKNHYPKGLRNN